ncbi:uncharacterized protein LOC109715547 isoform X2 [Ananas comosus]|uniref:Uncharacterized protein LOC109715547 isoform X2 n=1 Tax=Ananas comosus TaxID=4615 RepID=A0A6P5FJU6_ANACO|nr:uncharacterized protein LOC109715547 isoform X2 [Ananas comosus]
MMEAASRWGTWEELLLGGAVLRHGAAAWDAVAADLRSRTPFPTLFSPQECEVKFAEVQERYCGCDAWYEELRKQRVAELRRELEKSENSIGSLQSKLESLSTGRQSEGEYEYDTSHTESPSPNGNAADVDSSSKELSRDRSSAGSFTEEVGKSYTNESKELANGNCIFRKKRGKRQRRFYTVVKEGSVGDSEAVNSTACLEREGSFEGHKQGISLSPKESASSMKGESNKLDLAGILKSLSQHRDFSMFQRRLDSQKRAKYKKMIRQHIDFQMIILKISRGLISSPKELLRDLLLLVNNTLVFYHKGSVEHKSALTLREFAIKSLRQCSEYPAESSKNCSASSSPAVKARNVWRGGYSTERKEVADGEEVGIEAAKNGKKNSPVKVPESSLTNSRGSLTKKRGVGLPAKGGQRGGRGSRQGSPKKGRKRSRS